MLLHLFNSLALYTADEWMRRQIRKVTDRVFDAIKNESGRANLKFEDLYIAVLIVYKWDVCFITVFQHFSLVDKIFFWFKLWVHLNNSSKSGCFYVLVISISICLVHMLILPQKAKSKKSWRYFNCFTVRANYVFRLLIWKFHPMQVNLCSCAFYYNRVMKYMHFLIF